MSHYFLHDESLKNEDIDVKFNINNVDFHLVSNNGIFSKNRLDEGSRLLIEELLKLNLNAKLLDLGCGYGPIGLVIKFFFKDADLYLSDVNESCIELAKNNLNRYKLEGNLILSDGFNNISESDFKYIVFNPPIRIGKEKIYKIYDDAYLHLCSGGCFIIVIRKDKGALSHKKYLDSMFKESYLLNKDKGYFVYIFIK